MHKREREKKGREIKDFHCWVRVFYKCMITGTHTHPIFFFSFSLSLSISIYLSIHSYLSLFLYLSLSSSIYLSLFILSLSLYLSLHTQSKAILSKKAISVLHMVLIHSGCYGYFFLSISQTCSYVFLNVKKVLKTLIYFLNA